jgi:hypothetical protein
MNSEKIFIFSLKRERNGVSFPQQSHQASVLRDTLKFGGFLLFQGSAA